MENPDRVTYFAATDSRGKRIPFGIKTKDRAKHMYVIGKTGMGKSTFLENMAIQDIRNGEGLAFIDPHGSAVEKLLDYIPAERVKDVVYFAPFDLEQPIAFNVMEDVGYDKRHLVVSGLMATFKKIWVDAWSARMEYILSNTLLALLEYPGATLLGVNRMYSDKAYRKKVVDNIKDPVVKDFWTKEFAQYTDRFTQEATPAIQNKIGQFTSNPLIRNIIGQSKSSFDIRELMDNKKILLINLSKGQVGDTNMKLLGSMITTRIFLAAMSRAELSAAEIAKTPSFYFYVDEFQNFANETFAEILSEARKYKLALTIAHQYVEQMEEEVRAAVFGNVGTTVAFRVGPFDAEVLETVYLPEFTKEDLVNLGFTQIYLTLMIDGVGSRPFSALTIPSIEPPQNSRRKEVIEASRQTFGNPRAGIEHKIVTDLTPEEPAPAEPSDRPKKPPMRPQSSSTGGSFQGSSQGNYEQREQRAPAPRPYEGNRETSTRPREEVRPRSNDRPPQQQYEQRRSDFPQSAPQRPVQQAAPTPPSKSAEDLKAILRGMSDGAKKEKQVEVVKKQSSLKDALADVLAKNPTQNQPAAAPAPRETPTQPLASGQSPQQQSPVQEKKPFEVPEDTLRALFKENL